MEIDVFVVEIFYILLFSLSLEEDIFSIKENFVWV